jgi:hypothetical protein
MACTCGSQPRFGGPCACHMMRVRLTRIVRRPLRAVGELRGVIYRTRRVTNPTGTRLYIMGGQYRVTPRGIEG